MATQSNVIKMPGAREAPRSQRSKMDTLLLTPSAVQRWHKPPFQRELRMTKKVLELVKEIRENGGVISGILTLGVLEGETYIIDGQHRVAAFLAAELVEGLADVRICEFDSMAEMGEEFVKLNSALVRMKNEDILRGLEGINPHLAALRKRCPFIGYDRIRLAGSNASRPNEAKVVLSVAVAIRTWFGSEKTPTAGPSSSLAAKMLDDENVRAMTEFFGACHEAWGGERQNFRLWGALNLAVCGWMWRKTVLGEGERKGHGGAPPLKIPRAQFVQCLMSVSADARYVDWLVGRGLTSDRDRSPCYARLRDIFSKRLADGGHRSRGFPVGDWQKA